MKTYGSKASDSSNCGHRGCLCGDVSLRIGVKAFTKRAKSRARAEGRKAAAVDAE